ncbi:hypothetical protein ACQ4LE_008231 [Meloidogyne hapla]
MIFKLFFLLLLIINQQLIFSLEFTIDGTEWRFNNNNNNIDFNSDKLESGRQMREVIKPPPLKRANNRQKHQRLIEAPWARRSAAIWLFGNAPLF